MVDSPDTLLSLSYTSAAVPPFGSEALKEVLPPWQEINARAQLTGLLLYSRGRFLQTLEGPADSVRQMMSTIAADPRHDDVRIVVEEQIDRRRFPDWAMEFQPLTETIANSIPGYRTFFTDVDTSNDDPAQLAGALQEMMRWYRARATQSW
ncbi:BLUF domain-containing protein [Microbacterium sp. P05]|uniref:BLUF domain-containing protein n=1 Tax=Microbacterium sp. P05 TaxID=3366948 RepID=UPI003746FF35